MRLGIKFRAGARALARFCVLSAREQGNLLRAVPIVVITRAALWLLPYRVVAPVSRQVKPITRTRARTPAELALAVARASRAVPRATCLTQALALQYLLSWNGYASELVIGVGFDKEQRFQAHAWLVHEGETLIGGGPAPRFVPLERIPN